MSSRKMAVGIDVGSVSVAAAIVDTEGGVLATEYEFHKGDVHSTLKRCLERLPDLVVHAAAATTAEATELAGFEQFDKVLCAIEASPLLCPKRRALFLVGGERFHLIRFHEDGSYRDTRSNTSCAAGTGSFLDQQAFRLGLCGSEDLARVAARNEAQVPRIASRCSVFAKTDLIHAQQEGYRPEQICEGLAAGVARNIADTVVGLSALPTPVYMAGGVALNSEVLRHLSKRTGTEIRVAAHSEVFSAVGAGMLALESLERSRAPSPAPRKARDALSSSSLQPRRKVFCHEPLRGPCPEPDLSDAAGEATSSGEKSQSGPSEPLLFVGERSNDKNPVETEVYELYARDRDIPVYLGVDIGSTSTKAILIKPDGGAIAGFYTRTAGRPIEATQAVLEAVRHVETDNDCSFEVIGVGTTGSGRKLVGAVIGADLVLDEITAHARAATEIDPEVDTIIEIGGQDAKFTTLRKGIVTFSHMNTVCAAGTGSFIEEQAAGLGVALRDVASRAARAKAPRTSDRCTVFMERDINHLLAHGYAVDEILAAVMHSVVENYLHKVATAGLIGERVCFQGATAKNSALVQAFGRKLERPIAVSKYCHLTGALGTALTVRDERGRAATSFKGIGLWKDEIELRSEICELCANACKLRVARVGGRQVAFGLLCGRDYEADGPPKLRVKARDGVELRRKRYANENAAVPPLPERRRDVTVGVPGSLYLMDDAELWRRFFAELGVSVVISGPGAGREGRRLSGAEFCAPMADFHGHVHSLLQRVDYVFLPHQLRNEARCASGGCVGYPAGDMCYYTQYAPTVIRAVFEDTDRLLSPLIGGPGGLKATKRELNRTLGSILEAAPQEVSDAFDRAVRFDTGVRIAANEAYVARERRRRDVEVVLVGRPYTILSPRMNKRIPRSFSSLGVPVNVQDEIPESLLERAGGIRPEEMEDVPWSYAARILAVARYAASAESLYPVFITSFRCSPDAFVIDAFREILDAAKKPYLILQVDDLDSAVGYETRIEAGVRAFRNHLRSVKGRDCEQESSRLDDMERGEEKAEEGLWSASKGFEAAAEALWAPVKSLWGQLPALREKTLLVPCWDRFVCELLVEMFRSRGVDARLLEETPELIARGMRHNSGQCIPVNVVAEECVDFVGRYSLDPRKTALWVPKASWACNIPMYPSFLHRILRAEGLEELDVFRGVVTFADIDPTAPVEAYFAFLFGGLLRRFGCMIRPYEEEAGATDAIIEECLNIFRDSFRSRISKEEALKEVASALDAIPRSISDRPKVAVFGDFYVRDNDVFNQGLISTIERAGGEVVTTPYSEYARIVSSAHFRRLLMHGNFGEWTMLRALLAIMERFERRYRRGLGAPFNESPGVTDENLEGVLESFGMRIEQSGETFENILKVLHLQRRHPDLGLLVQVNPAFCCPALVTEAMSEKIKALTGVPMVCITYDGTTASKNHVVEPYLRHAATREELRRAG